MAGFEPATSRFRTAVTPDICIIQDTNDSADLNSAHQGQFQEKEKTPTTELNTFLSEIFFRRNITIDLRLSSFIHPQEYLQECWGGGN